MKGITIKLSDTTLRQLRDEARETGRSVAALFRERVEAPPDHTNGSVFALTSDLAGQPCGRPPPRREHAAQVPAVVTAISDTWPARRLPQSPRSASRVGRRRIPLSNVRYMPVNESQLNEWGNNAIQAIHNAKRSSAERTQPELARFCQNCGRALVGTERFCSSCGTRMGL